MVRDPSGAAIPAAAVTLEQVATGAKTESKANESGLLLFPGLTPGEYRVTATASGLERWTGIVTPLTGQVADLPVVLQIAATKTEVVVQAGVTPPVTTENATLANTLENKRLAQLPLNGRFIQNCIIFRAFDGRLMLVPHQPNRGPEERARLFELEERGDTLEARK